MHAIYLDNAATTRPDPSLQETWAAYASDLWYNPSALYRPALEVRSQIEEARRTLLAPLGNPRIKCLFTSGGTESANMVIRRGTSRRRNANFVMGGFEHPCVEESFRALAQDGAEVRTIPARKDGRIEVDQVLRTIDENTAFISVMHVNNETGALNDIAVIAREAKRKSPHALFHADGVQAYLRTPPVDMSQIDYYTVSAHKIHGPKGVGAVFYRDGSPLKAFLEGGGQEQGLRSGTENVFGILAFAKAVSVFGPEHAAYLAHLRTILEEETRTIEGACILSPEREQERAAHILCISFPGLRGETLMHLLEQENVFVSTGSACSSRKGKSRMEKALGLPKEVAQGVVRLSLARTNTEEDVRAAARVLGEKVGELRKAIGGKQ